MKNIFFILLLSLAPCWVIAQTDTNNPGVTPQDTITNTGEAGAIHADDADTGKPGSLADNWIYLLLGGIVIAVISAAVTRALAPKQQKIAEPEPEVLVTNSSEPKSKEPKANAAELKKLKQEVKMLSDQVEMLKAGNDTLEKNLGIYKNFDSTYFGEAFRKLVAPMNEALENGSRREITEYLMKIMFHFSSLTRYKIAKKQPYDEANIHYLLNQKGSGDAAVTEVNKDTPVDKIPKNIKTITDMLKEQDSKGLDDSIVAGYKIKNL